MRFTAADRKRIGNMSTPVDAATLREQLRPLDKQLRQLTEEWNAPAKQGGQMTEAEARRGSPSSTRSTSRCSRSWSPRCPRTRGRRTSTARRSTAEQLRRNTMGGKGGKYGKMKSVKQEELELAEAKLHDMIAKHPEHPVVRQVAALMHERQQLGDILTQRGGATIMGETAEAVAVDGRDLAVRGAGAASPDSQEGHVGGEARQGVAQGTDGLTVHGLNDLKEQAANLTDRINELRGTPGPEIKELRRDVAEIRKQIRDAEAPRARVMRGERPHVITAAGDIVRPIGANHADRIGAALSVAKDKLQQAEAAAARRQKPTGIVGGETALPGRGFVSGRVAQKRLASAEAGVLEVAGDGARPPSRSTRSRTRGARSSRGSSPRASPGRRRSITG
jgi:TolA-binding protein